MSSGQMSVHLATWAHPSSSYRCCCTNGPFPSTYTALKDHCTTLQSNYVIYYILLNYTSRQDQHFTLLHYTTLHYTTLHYTTLHYTKLHYTTLHYTTLHYTTLHYTTLHYTKLHYTTLHYTTLNYTTLHYTTYTTLHYQNYTGATSQFASS